MSTELSQESYKTGYNFNLELQKWLTDTGLTQKEAAGILGIGVSTLKTYMAGTSIPSQHKLPILRLQMDKARSIVNTSKDEMHMADLEQRTSDQWESYGYVPAGNPRDLFIPLLDVRASVASNMVHEGEPDVVGYIPVSEQVVHRIGMNRSQLKWLTITGDSMGETLRPGEQVLVVLQAGGEPIHDSAIYILLMDGVMMVKRLYKRKTCLFLKGDHDEGFELAGDEIHRLQIIGRVVYGDRWF